MTLKQISKKKIIVIEGPTASGKTRLSLKLAKATNSEIIVADSRAIYKNLDIVSAKPSIEEQKEIKHHLIDIIEPTESFSAGDFAARASKIIDESNKNFIVSGGSWFYIKALLGENELLECPSNPSLRQELEELDNNTLWDKLDKIDPKRASLIHPNNKEKVIRSIEMCLYFKKPISEVELKKNEKYDTIYFSPLIEREELYKRIDKRVDIMIEEGLYEEWKNNKTLYPNCDILKNTIGYSEFFEFEEGLYSNLNEAIDKIKQHTRNFAKRQLTYYKSRDNINYIKDINEILEVL